jgi:hypothetical protein
MTGDRAAFSAIAPDDAPRYGGLWTQPNPEREPELHSIWKAMTIGTKQIKVKVRENAPHGKAVVKQPPPSPQRQLVVRPRADPPRNFRMAKRGLVSSLNWSGAVVPADSGRRFTRVAAQWRVPSLDQSKPLSDSLVSIWIGLGGWLPWAHPMPQMGSEHGWTRENKPVNRLWCQCWQGRTDGDGWLSRIVYGLEIEPHQEILCHLAVLDDGSVEFYFFNSETKKLAGVTAKVGKPVVGSTAEWVVEPPTRVDYDDDLPGDDLSDSARTSAGRRLRQIGPHPLPDFAPLIMENCAARLGGATDYRRRRPSDGYEIMLIGRSSPGSAQVLRSKTKDATVKVEAR